MISKKRNIKNYMYLNITMLLLSIYVIFFPIFAKLMSHISPILTTCVYKKVTGKDCPLCGGTRYIANVKQVFEDPSYILCPFGYMILFVIFEFLFRIFLIIKIKRNNIKNLKRIIIFDIVIHVIVFILFFIYEISFLVNN